eukprot:2414221-Prymnesium_polylepis.1
MAALLCQSTPSTGYLLENGTFEVNHLQPSLLLVRTTSTLQDSCVLNRAPEDFAQPLQATCPWKLSQEGSGHVPRAVPLSVRKSPFSALARARSNRRRINSPSSPCFSPCCMSSSTCRVFYAAAIGVASPVGRQILDVLLLLEMSRQKARPLNSL